MKKRNASKILLVIAALFAIIGLFCMFASAFYEGDQDTVANIRGNVFVIMFGTGLNAKSGEITYNVVWPLVIAFAALLLTILLPLVALPLSKKGTTVIAGIEAILSLAIGVVFFFAVDLYASANAAIIGSYGLSVTGQYTIGTGCICVIVFAFLSAAAALLALLLGNKKKEN